MKAIKARLTVDQIRQPAEGALQGALIAEITRAQENIRFSLQQRTQAIYYLLGFIGAVAALALNAVTKDSFASALNSRSDLRFAALILAAQFLLWITGLLAAIVYGVVFKANDAVRFLNREIARLNDVLYGLPNDTDTANPAWVAVHVTKHDMRDRHDVFSERSVSESIALAVYLIALVVLIVFTCYLQRFISLTACIAGGFYALTLFAVAWWWIFPLLSKNYDIYKHDRNVNVEWLRALERERKEK